MDKILTKLDQITARLDQVQKEQCAVSGVMAYMEKLEKKFENLFMEKFLKELQGELKNSARACQEQAKQQTEHLGEQLKFQSQKQAILEDKISEIITTIQQEKFFLRDKFNEAQSQVGSLTTGIQSHASTPSRSNYRPALNQLAQSEQGNDVSYLEAMVNEQNEKLNEIKKQVFKIENSCLDMKRSSNRFEQVLDNRLSELVADVTIKVTRSLSVVDNISDVVKSVTRSELVWLDHQIDRKLDEASRNNVDVWRTTSGILQLEDAIKGVSKLIKDMVSSQQFSVDRCCEENRLRNVISATKDVLVPQQDTESNLVDKYHISISETLRKEIDKIGCMLESNKKQTLVEIKRLDPENNKSNADTSYYILELRDKVERLNSDLSNEFQTFRNWVAEYEMTGKQFNNSLGKCFEKIDKLTEATTLGSITLVKENTEVLKEKILTLEKIVPTIASTVNTVNNKLDGLINQIKKIETNLNSVQKSIKKDLNVTTKKQDEIKNSFEQFSTEMKFTIDVAKQEILAVTEKEAQIVRCRIDGPLPFHRTYVFDFYVLNFKSVVGSGENIRSIPWHINQIRSCVRGHVILSADGDLIVRLLHGRHPSSVGLQPYRGNTTLRVKATICDLNNQALPNLLVGEKTWTANEEEIPTHLYGGWGKQIGEISCQNLILKGYGDKEGYYLSALLVRYDVTVL